MTWNRQAERLFGYEAGEAIGRTAAELGGGRAEPAVLGEVRSRVRGGGVWDGEVPRGAQGRLAHPHPRRQRAR